MLHSYLYAGCCNMFGFLFPILALLDFIKALYVYSWIKHWILPIMTAFVV